MEKNEVISKLINELSKQRDRMLSTLANLNYNESSNFQAAADVKTEINNIDLKIDNLLDRL